VPTLRHPMVNASATAALTALAPGRVAVAFGTGFAGARALGSAPASWSYLREYVAAFRGLLTGAAVTWQGSRMRMMHPDGHAPARPIDVPILISALGPKGLAVATELADGLFTATGQTRFASRFDWPRWPRTAPCWPTVSLWTRRGYRRPRGPEMQWPTMPPTSSVARSPPCRVATCGSTPSTRPHHRIATSRGSGSNRCKNNGERRAAQARPGPPNQSISSMLGASARR